MTSEHDKNFSKRIETCLDCNCPGLAFDSVAKHHVLTMRRPDLNKNTEHIFHSGCSFAWGLLSLPWSSYSMYFFFYLLCFAAWFNVWKINTILRYNRSVVFDVIFHWRRGYKRVKTVSVLFQESFFKCENERHLWDTLWNEELLSVS